MRVISNSALVAFACANPSASDPLQAWRKIVEATRFSHFADLKRTFNTVDHVGNYYVFDISGNHFRIVAAIHFNRQMLFIRHIFSHRDYEKWRP